MATLKLKRPAAPKTAEARRAPIRGQGPKRPRPTLAQAEAERAQRRAAAPPERDTPPPSRRSADAPRRAAATGSQRRPAATGRPPAAAARPVPRAVQPDAAPQAAHAPGSLRLSKQMTELGLASRREADEWIAAGWVRVDGRVVDTLGARVQPGQRIEVDPRARQEQARRVTVLLHKPLGVVSGQAEDGHAPAVTLVTAANRWAGDAAKDLRFSPSQLRGLAPAGRLDLDSTGLLVLTQDGRIAKALIGEDSRVEKEYLVRVAWIAQPGIADLKAAFPPEALARLRHGLVLDGRALQPAKVSWQSEQQLRIVLREGMKRQIRRMCEAVGLKVVALKRIRIGRIALGDLPVGQWRFLAPWESFD